MHLAQRAFRFEMRLGRFHKLKFFFQVRRAHLLEIFFQAFQAFFDLPKIANHQIEFHILDVTQWVDRADMRNARIIESTHNVRQRIHVPQTSEVGCLFQGFLANRANVNVFDGGMRKFFRLINCG